MEKLNNIPHKFLFYVGFFIVLIFLSLSYWQFTSFQDDKITLNEFKNNNISSSISISDLYSNNNENVFEFNKVVIKNSKNFTKISDWYLRSRVNNGQNGFHLITLYKESNNDKYLLVNNGWVPLDKNVNKTFPKEEILFVGRLMKYDQQTFGQDDISNSEYLFRIDKDFIESETNVILPNYYLTLTEACGGWSRVYKSRRTL
jgi:Uncharacterized conserved protein